MITENLSKKKKKKKLTEKFLLPDPESSTSRYLYLCRDLYGKYMFD